MHRGLSCKRFPAERGYEAVIVAEPTRCEAVLAHRGISSVRMRFSGRAGHASSGSASADSAVHQAIRWGTRALDYVEAQAHAAIRRADRPSLQYRPHRRRHQGEHDCTRGGAPLRLSSAAVDGHRYAARTLPPVRRTGRRRVRRNVPRATVARRRRRRGRVAPACGARSRRRAGPPDRQRRRFLDRGIALLRGRLRRVRVRPGRYRAGARGRRMGRARRSLQRYTETISRLVADGHA